MGRRTVLDVAFSFIIGGKPLVEILTTLVGVSKEGWLPASWPLFCNSKPLSNVFRITFSSENYTPARQHVELQRHLACSV